MTDKKIGFAKPPKHTQFQKGQSGNPKGRPKGTRNLGTYIKKAAKERVAIKENGKTKLISKVEASVKQLANQAASGDQRAIKGLLDRIGELEAREASAANRVFPFTDADREVIAEIYRRLKSEDDND